MLLNRLPSYIARIWFPNTSSLLINPSYYFSRSDRTKRQSVSPQFSTMQHQKSQSYFQQYRNQIQNDSILSKFRRQVFNTTSTSNPSQLRSKSKLQNMRGQTPQEMDLQITRDQRYIDQLLQNGKKEEIVNNSKKILEGFKNRKKVVREVKGKGDVKSVFGNYADYTKYKENYVTVEDRNYLDGDRLDKTNNQRNMYKFLESLPDGYKQKKQAIKAMEAEFPIQSQNGGMTLSQYGKILQKRHEKVKNWQSIYNEKIQQNHFKMNLLDDQQISPKNQTVYETLENSIDLQQRNNFQLGTLSNEAINKIYDLYLQGWSIREISRRFGILPMRAKFYVWTRARFYNQFLPKYGLRYLFATIAKQAEQSQNNYIIDYGLDLDQLSKTDIYEQITSWQSSRIDSQRDAKSYTDALQKLQKNNKFAKYDMLQIGTHGKQNKKHMLKEWKIHKGKGSDQYFLKNQHKVWRKFMFQNMKKNRAVYY